MALITVIAVLALVTVLLIGFLSLARTELASSNNFSHGLQARSLSETATNMVISQIRAATNQQNTAWASQPGALRTFAINGDFARGFKLYSDRSMVVDDEAALSGDLPDSDWDGQESRYVDLNSPSLINGQRRYPVVDPRSYDFAKGGSATDVAGFSYKGGVIEGVTATELPMPVEWLYMLEDGTLGYLDEDDKLVSMEGGGEVTAENPIVGRVAFWADDETAKVNINTASEPTFWDLPRSTAGKFKDNNPYANIDPTGEDLWYAKFQPAQNEWQRYPGHPATTALSTVLFPGELTPANKQSIYDMVPRIIGEGGKSGTKKFYEFTRIDPALDRDRLFAAVDEFLFSPKRTTSTYLDTQRLEASRFFLTASSRAPELNLWNLPRMAIWPVDSPVRTGFELTAQDQLFKFCSSIGATGSKIYQYIFQRVDAHNAHLEWTEPRNVELYKYLQRLTSSPVPGYGGNFLAKFGPDRDQIITEIFDYIRCSNNLDPHRTKQWTQDQWDRGQVIPLRTLDNQTMGFGRQHSVNHVGLAFLNGVDAEFPESNQGGAPGFEILEGRVPDPSDATKKLPLPADRVGIQPLLIVEAFVASQGFRVSTEHWLYSTVTGMSSLRVKGYEDANSTTLTWIPLYSKDQVNIDIRDNGGYHSRSWGGNIGIRSWLNQQDVIGRMIQVPKDQPLEFSGGTLNLNLFQVINGGYTFTPGNGKHIHQITLEFPPAEFPVPKIDKVGTPATGWANGSSGAVAARNWWKWADRLARKDGVMFYPWGPSNDDPFTSQGYYTPLSAAVLREGDTVRSLVLCPGQNDPRYARTPGDARLACARHTIPAGFFRPHYAYHDLDRPVDHIFWHNPAGPHYIHGTSNSVPDDGTIQRKPMVANAVVPTQLTDSNYHFAKMPHYPKGYVGAGNAVIMSGHITTGDFDNGVALTPDGAYINKPDDGNGYRADRAGQNVFDKEIPYLTVNWGYQSPGQPLYSPNRQIPSPVMFGSLSTGVKRELPWQTLLFRPQANHPNHNPEIPDHILLDLFWMPVIEPYAISEPFSTGGKININTQILPFSYITRQTGLHSVMGSEEMLIIPDKLAADYKNWDHSNPDYKIPVPPRGLRRKIDLKATLAQWDSLFDAGKAFRSASEICDMHLVPMNDMPAIGAIAGSVTYNGGASLKASDMPAFWEAHSPTGDNSRERPYAHIYPRITTKSNTFRIHVVAQVLRKSRSSDPAAWEPDRGDSAVSEYRGSTLIERYIDPNERNIPDFATQPVDSATDLEPYYRFRVVNQMQFTG